MFYFLCSFLVGRALNCSLGDWALVLLPGNLETRSSLSAGRILLHWDGAVFHAAAEPLVCEHEWKFCMVWSTNKNQQDLSLGDVGVPLRGQNSDLCCMDCLYVLHSESPAEMFME